MLASTEYLYGVTASNIAGSTNGTWASGRTREGGEIIA